MVDEKKNNTDDFFRLITEDDNKAESEVIEDPFAGDEIIFKDEKGQINVLKGNQASGLSQPAVKESSQVEQKKEVEVGVTPVVPAGKSVTVEKEVERIVQKSKINFSDDQAKERFKNIILARLKDVRDQMETRELLLSSSLVGGMGFDEQTADQVLSLTKSEFDHLDEKLRDAVSQEPFADLQAEAKGLLKEKIESPSPPSLIFPTKEEKEEDVLSDKPPKGKTEVQSSKQKVFEPVEKAVPVPIPAPAQFDSPRPAPATTEKPKIEDVKFKPQLTGPVEEIRSLTLADFRRLSDDSREVMEKILEKIEIIEEESFSKKIEAIQAWKQSEVYQLYLEIGNISMESKIPVAEIIAERKKSLKPTLTEKEFETISDLNQKLRY